MQERHRNRKAYFEEQGITTRKYVIPYIDDFINIKQGIRVLEIGCGEGGNLLPFVEHKCEVFGVDLNSGQLNNAQIFLDESYENHNVKLLNRNIYDVSSKDIGEFDVIMLRDVIEHIPNQGKFLNHLRTFMKPQGIVFFGFPPWRMPFGGHQQICRNRFLSKVPYFHLFPDFIYASILKLFREPKGVIDSLLEIKSTGIGTKKFERLVHENNFSFAKKDFYLINPNYEIKFGLKPRIQNSLIQKFPYFRDFVTTCMYCVIHKN